MKNLELEFESIKAELEIKRKKEKDEIIVLSTAPLYLAIPFLGPLIMAGVLIGVGADLGVLRGRIKKLAGDSKDVGDKLGTKKSFKANYDVIKTLTEKTANDIKANQDHVAKLKDGWGSIASDFKMVEKYLKDSKQDGGKDEWFDVAVDLGAARSRWKKIADRADHFRLNATITQSTTPEQFVASVRDEKAA